MCSPLTSPCPLQRGTKDNLMDSSCPHLEDCVAIVVIVISTAVIVISTAIIVISTEGRNLGA